MTTRICDIPFISHVLLARPVFKLGERIVIPVSYAAGQASSQEWIVVTPGNYWTAEASPFLGTEALARLGKRNEPDDDQAVAPHGFE